MSLRLFDGSEQAKNYAKFRPGYPKSVIQTIVDYCKLSSNEFDLAVDVGCGSGQSTIPLKCQFKKVIGMDISEKQIEQGRQKYGDIDFRVGIAEDLSFLDSNSVDLITVASAFHWMNHEKFYKEAVRVLKPSGVLSVYAYGIPLEDKKEAHEIIDNFYFNTILEYWNKEISIVREEYRSIMLPFPGWIRNDDLEIVEQRTLDQYMGYIASMSSWQKYVKVNTDTSPLDEVYKKLQELYPGDELITIRWPIFMLLGRKPKL